MYLVTQTTTQSVVPPPLRDQTHEVRSLRAFRQLGHEQWTCKEQGLVVTLLLENRLDLLMVMPTGHSKSAVFTIPPMVTGHTIIVVVPLTILVTGHEVDFVPLTTSLSSSQETDLKIVMSTTFTVIRMSTVHPLIGYVIDEVDDVDDVDDEIIRQLIKWDCDVSFEMDRVIVYCFTRQSVERVASIANNVACVRIAHLHAHLEEDAKKA
ncbi:unnamed protein product [Sphagnum jensenii]|uniref:DNA 3'-5' helicase n=1 Tax=Sphagnum jensenii TaxID=128206 RepID=A0ABP1AXH7_9BRYO